MAAIKKPSVYQLDMFGGEPDVIKPRRKKMSDIEKQERKEKRDIEKKLKNEKEFEDYWKKHGYSQGYLFDDEGNMIDESKISPMLREEINKILIEEINKMLK